MPRLPDKNVLASFNLEPKEFQEARLHELEKYIERLLHHPQVRLSSELKWFLFDEALHFSSEKGEFIEQTGAFGGLGSFTASMASLGRTLLTKYIGNKEPKN